MEASKNGMTHQLEYVSGQTGREWVHLDSATHLLTNDHGHGQVEYTEVREHQN